MNEDSRPSRFDVRKSNRYNKYSLIDFSVTNLLKPPTPDYLKEYRDNEAVRKPGEKGSNMVEACINYR